MKGDAGRASAVIVVLLVGFVGARAQESGEHSSPVSAESQEWKNRAPKTGQWTWAIVTPAASFAHSRMRIRSPSHIAAASRPQAEGR